jgi:hypothetical protein
MNCRDSSRSGAFLKTPAWLIALCACILHSEMCAGEPASPHVAAQQAADQGTAGVLVLQDGGVLSGTFSTDGKRYVLIRDGSELQIPASRVLVACRSLEEAYDERRRQLQRPSADAHLALAAWCVRYNLLPQAARELLDARGLEPNHRGLALLERRLAAAGSPPPQRSGPKVERTVVPVSYVEPNTARADPPQPAIAVDELPAGSIERFTRKVQPILVNNCTLSRCHQPGGEQTFQLDRALLHGMANRRSTMQNLAATLALVDRQQPHLSHLLTVPRKAHGGMRSAVFGPRHTAAYSHLVDWVALVTKSDGAAEHLRPADVESAQSPDDENSLASAGGETSALQLTANSISISGAADIDQLPVRRPVQREIRFGAQLQARQPKDAFDPEIFNRQRLIDR